jgi:hypothetical protein
MSCGLHGAGRCAAFIGRAQQRDARLQCRGTATILTCVCTRPATDRWAHGGGTARHVLPRDGSHSQATGAKGNQLLVPRGSGACPARTPRWWNVSRAAQGRQAERRRAGGALERGRAVFPAGQPYFDCTALQKIKLCDKNDRYKSCRRNIPLQYWQRPSYVFLDGLSRNAKQSLGFVERG